MDKAPVVIEKLQRAKIALQSFMQAYGLFGKPEEIAQLKGDEARIGFVKVFKDVQKLQTARSIHRPDARAGNNHPGHSAA